MTMAIQQRFSISGRRYRVRLVSIEESPEVLAMKRTGMLKTFKDLAGIGDDGKTKYSIQFVMRRKRVRVGVWATDELQAITKTMSNMRCLVIKFNRQDRYDRPKRLQRRK